MSPGMRSAKIVGFECGVCGDGVDMVVDVVEFGAVAIGDLARRANLRRRA